MSVYTVHCWQTWCICCMRPPGSEENYLHSKTSGAISLPMVDKSNLGGGGEGRMSSWSGNHLRVNSFCDAPRPAWWTSHGTREVADVSVIITWPPGTLAAIAVQKKKKTVRFPVKGDIRGFFHPLSFYFLINPGSRNPAVSWHKSRGVRFELRPLTLI